MKVFFAVLSRKCGSFHKRGRTNSTHFLYSYVAMHNLCMYPYYPSVGHCIRFLLSGLSTTSILIDEINSTLSFYIIVSHRSCVCFYVFFILMNSKVYDYYLKPNIEVLEVFVEAGLEVSSNIEDPLENSTLDW